MVKNNMKIKDNITIDDKVNAAERIVDYFFVGGEYTPYYSEVGETVAIIENFIEGIKFDEDDDKYKLAIEDEELNVLIGIFYLEPYLEMPNEGKRCAQVMNYVMNCVFEKVKFQKDLMIAQSSTSAVEDKLIEILERENQRLIKEIDATDMIADFVQNINALTEGLNTEEQNEIMKKFADSNFSFDSESIASAFSKELFGNKLHQEKEDVVQELIEEKKKIKETKKELQELQIAYAQEQQKNEVRNVINYDSIKK